MKNVLTSIQPKWVAKILNGEKTIEIRKRFPKDYRGWVYIYCTKNGGNLVYGDTYKGGSFVEEYAITKGLSKQEANKNFGLLNGKVVARFYCDNVEEYINGHNCRYIEHNASSCLDFEKNKVCENACLTEDELFEYCEDLHFYAIHISQLEIFDKPKELSEFGYRCCNYDKCINCRFYNNGNVSCSTMFANLTKAPQSMMYIEID